jgi:hypothetical protein
MRTGGITRFVSKLSAAWRFALFFYALSLLGGVGVLLAIGLPLVVVDLLLQVCGITHVDRAIAGIDAVADWVFSSGAGPWLLLLVVLGAPFVAKDRGAKLGSD